MWSDSAERRGVPPDGQFLKGPPIKALPPEKLGLNQGGYGGEGIDPGPFLDSLSRWAARHAWEEKQLALDEKSQASLAAFTKRRTHAKASVFLSAGIHGDEPASTLALISLMEEGGLREDFNYTIFPCLNPRGMLERRRETPEGKDLNRDYLHRSTLEVQRQLEAIDSWHPFDMALFLHEDWEAHGFYLYELMDAASTPVLGRSILQAIRGHVPVESASWIDGRTACNGLIAAPFEETQRKDWPEAFFFKHRGTRHCLTLEAPSDFPLKDRVHWLKLATRAALAALVDPAIGSGVNK